MAVITSLTPQKRDKTRCNVEVDGRFFCGMELATVLQNGLNAGMEIAPETLAAIQLESERATALDKALGHISARMKTEREVRSFLEKKGYLAEVCESVIARMKELGFLDDGAYARLYAESAAKRKGTRLIAAELRAKGVSDEAIGEALGDVQGGEEAAKEILRKYLRGKEADEATLRRAYARLIAKGFDYDTARAALRSLGEEYED